ncbi:hypothetical protein PR048_011533 [Dryococelus australis]|uniref:Uncharacterized protein n=1 Tax=Dryococelus australis TaxID=614101 RepID=A0ABQ9HMK9_9NEOP|nr:hypothetical protein PR048_011533 [Dryococelus australis]
MRKGTKSSLQSGLEQGTSTSQSCLARPETYIEVCDQHIAYLNSHYSLAFVVFDGYSIAPSTKDGKYMRWAGKTPSNVFEVQEHNQVCSPQNEFLAFPVKETRLINLLTCCLQVSGYQVLQRHAEAHRLIVGLSTAIKMSKSVGELSLSKRMLLGRDKFTAGKYANYKAMSHSLCPL